MKIMEAMYNTHKNNSKKNVFIYRHGKKNSKNILICSKLCYSIFQNLVASEPFALFQQSTSFNRYAPQPLS